MSWLVGNGRVLASAEVAATRAARRRGLLGRDDVVGALVLPRCRWVHTMGMRFAIDVAHLDADGVLLRVTRMPRHRIGLPVPRARSVVEASAGAFERWGLCIGDVVEVRTADDAGSGGGRGSRPPADDASHLMPPRTLRHLTPDASVGTLRVATPELAAAG